MAGDLSWHKLGPVVLSQDVEHWGKGRTKIISGFWRGPLLSICLLLVALGATGCTPKSPAPTQTLTPTSPPPTPTLAFPTLLPTPTWTPAPVPSPSTLADLELGPLIYSEDFSRPTGWELVEGPSGATSISEGALKLAVRAQGVFRLTQAPVEAQGGVLLRALVRPELCSPGDVFGLAFRVNPSGEHYRFGLTCEGGARAYRFTLGSATTLSIAASSNAIIPGPGGVNELAAAVERDRMRLFVNNLEVFSLQDTQLAHGGFGLFARALGGQQLTVSFDDFEIWSLSMPATATPAPEH